MSLEDYNPLGLNQERLDLKVRVAGPDDWQALKQLREESLSGKDKEMLDSTLLKRVHEKIKGKKDWQKDIAREDEFFVLSFNGSDPIGMGLAKQKGPEWWHVGWLYVPLKYRGKGVGKKMTAFRLHQIIERGGKVVTGFIKNDNKENTGNTGYFSMKKIDPSLSKYPKKVTEKGSKEGHYEFEIDLTDAEVIRKINDALT